MVNERGKAVMYGYRKERIAECLAVLRGKRRVTGGWGEFVRQIHAVTEILESPDQEIAEPAQEETAKGKDRTDRMIYWLKSGYGFRKWGTA